MLVSDIMASVRDIVTISSDDQLKRHIASAVRDYSRYLPIQATTEISTVADQAKYTVTDAIYVSDAIWYPSGNVVNADALVTPRRTFPISAPDDMANRLIDAIAVASNEAAVRGSWRFENGSLWLHPTPTVAGLTVVVYYSTAHEISGSGATLAYTTIEDWTFDAVVWLTAASILQAQAAANAGKFSYKEGLTSVDRGNMPDNLVKTAQNYRSMAIDMIR